MSYKPRFAQAKLKEYGKWFRAVLVLGSRQVGKTTLLRQTFPNLPLITFDPVQDIHGARQDPDLFLDSFRPPLILDEIHIALKYKFLKAADVIKALRKKPPSQHVILTGRGAPRSLIKAADLVTEMKCVKHPFQCGVLAQPGIEF